MSGARAIRATAVTAIVTVLSLGGARADTYLFTDTLRPGGVARTEAAFHADEHRCGADANDHFGNVAAFKKCMRAHGWVADAYKPNPPKSRGFAPRPRRRLHLCGHRHELQEPR